MTLKNRIKAYRKQVVDLQEQYDSIYNDVLAKIYSDDGIREVLHDMTDKGKLQFYLLDEVNQGFSKVTSSLHRMWDSLP